MTVRERMYFPIRKKILQISKNAGDVIKQRLPRFFRKKTSKTRTDCLFTFQKNLIYCAHHKQIFCEFFTDRDTFRIPESAKKLRVFSTAKVQRTKRCGNKAGIRGPGARRESAHTSAECLFVPVYEVLLYRKEAEYVCRENL